MVQVLDSALLRPGRFDRQVTVDRPDVAGRVQILKVHSRGKQLGKDVDFDKVARRTPGARPRLSTAVMKSVRLARQLISDRDGHAHVTRAEKWSCTCFVGGETVQVSLLLGCRFALGCILSLQNVKASSSLCWLIVVPVFFEFPQWESAIVQI